MIKVVVADRCPLLVNAIENLISIKPSFQVVAHAQDLEALATIVSEWRPELAVIDDRIEAPAAIDEFCSHVLPLFPETHVVVFGEDSTRERALRYMTLGVRGFVSKWEPPERLLTALDDAMQGRHDWFLGSSRLTGHDFPHSRLTAREEQILPLLAARLTNAEISAELGIQVQTVKNHVSHILQKLGLNSRTELARSCASRASRVTIPHLVRSPSAS